MGRLKFFRRKGVLDVTELGSGKSTWMVQGTPHFHEDSPQKWTTDLDKCVQETVKSFAAERKIRIYRQVNPDSILFFRDYLLPIILSIALTLLCLFLTNLIDQRASDGYYIRAAIMSISLGVLFVYAGWIGGRGLGKYSQTLHPRWDVALKSGVKFLIVTLLFFGSATIADLPWGWDSPQPWMKYLFFWISPDNWLSHIAPLPGFILASFILVSAFMVGFADSQRLSLSKSEKVKKWAKEHPKKWCLYRWSRWEVDLDTRASPPPIPSIPAVSARNQ